MMCTVRWTHGRQGVSWEAGRKLEELEELQTRSFSPGCAAAVAADTLYSLLSWLIQQHNHRQSHGAIRRPQGLLRWCFCRHIVQSSRDRVYSDTHVQCYKWPQLLHNHVFFFILFIYLFILYCSGFAIHWHESAMDLHVFPFPIPPPIWSLWVFPVHQPWALVSCIQPGLVICFILDSILVSMLFSQNTPPSPSPTESKTLFCTSVSLFLFCK